MARKKVDIKHIVDDAKRKASFKKQRIIKFLQKPEEEQNKKMLNQEAYLTKMVEKSQDKLEKLRSENRKKEMNNLMIQCLVGDESILNMATMVDLNDLTWVINQNLMEINARLNLLEALKGASNLNGMAVNNGDEEQMEHMDAQLTNTINGDEVQQPFGDFANNNNNNNNLPNDDYVPVIPFNP